MDLAEKIERQLSSTTNFRFFGNLVALILPKTPLKAL